jgi:hypothetical protein
MAFNQEQAKCIMQFTKFTSNIIDNAIFDIQRKENLQLPNPCANHLLNLKKEHARFKVLTEVLLKFQVSWDVTMQQLEHS